MKLCVVAPNHNTYSETFIHAHMNHLPGVTINLVGDGAYFPKRELQGQEIYQPTIFHKLVKFMPGQLINNMQNQALVNFFKRKKIDVVLAEYGPTACAVLEACQMAKIPLVAHFHGYDAFQYSTAKQYHDNNQELFRKSKRLIAASKSMASQLCLLGASADKISVNHYGVDVKKFTGGSPSTAPPHFVAIGRFVEKKAPQLTVLAFQKVLKRVPEARLTMIGDGPLFEACKQIVHALNLEKQIALLGAKTPTEIIQELQRSRAFVQHSLRTSGGDSESLGVVFLEAGAMGLPAIGTRHDGIPEVILDGQTGLLADEGNIDEFADHMITLAQDPALAKTLGDTAHERIKSHFSEEISLTGLWNILTDVVKNS